MKRNKDLLIWDLDYWQSGEWQVVQERLDDHEKASLEFVPDRTKLFRAIQLLPLSRVKVAIIGQDPYPGAQVATGIAFDTGPGPTGTDAVQDDRWDQVLPSTLINIFKEYQSDLGYPAPKNGDLSPWVQQGVLLWNAYPSCLKGKPGSHHWDEWKPLTTEILEKLDAKGNVVFVGLGSTAKLCIKNAVLGSSCLFTSHPSPFGANKGFIGSYIFTKINLELKKLGQQPIDWRLPDE